MSERQSLVIWWFPRNHYDNSTKAPRYTLFYSSVLILNSIHSLHSIYLNNIKICFDLKSELLLYFSLIPLICTQMLVVIIQ